MQGHKGDFRAQWETALLESGEQTGSFRRASFGIGGVQVSVFGQVAADVALVPLLEPFRINTSEFDIGIQVQWVPNLDPHPGRNNFDSGTTWSLFETDFQFGFDFHSPNRNPRLYKRLLTDKQFKTAALLMNERYFADVVSSPEPLGYPLDELLIMHRLTQEKAIELHGAGMVTADGIGNLFVGHSGAGKSTTTRLWTACQDVEVLSDDRIIVRLDEDTVQTPFAASDGAGEHGVLRLRDRSASPTGRFAQDDKSKCAQMHKGHRMRMYGTPWHGEAMYASPNSAPLARIFVLEHGQGNVVTRLSPSQAVAELFARSFVPFHRHEYVESALAFLEELVEEVPCYHFSFEPDQRAVETILNFHD